MNNDDFWTKLASGNTRTVLAGSMDAHLSGKSIDDIFSSRAAFVEGVLRSSFLPDEVLDGTNLFLTAEKGKYIVHTRFQKWFASKYLAKAERVFEEMLLGKLPRHHSKMASAIRVASLGDLTQFLKRADGKLIHKSTNDLWSYSKDADGNFLVERLFDDEGEPLKG